MNGACFCLPGYGDSDCSKASDILAKLYPSFTQLTLQRDAVNKSMFGSLWYENDVQFNCNITNCDQFNSGSTNVWSCTSLNCQCNAGTKFCGGGGVVDLTKPINQANGGIVLACGQTDPNKCNVAFDFLKALLPQGIDMDTCSFGECADTAWVFTADDIQKSLDAIGIYGYLGISAAGAAVLATIVALISGAIQRANRKRMALPAPHLGVGISVNDLSYTVGSKQILKNLSGEFPGGQLTAIMGPSGSGKTTLLDILAGKRKSGSLKGSFSVGKDLSALALRSIRGYVDQEDVFMPTMTPREVLMFSASLRLPESISTKDKRERVNLVLEELGLTGIADSRIGNSLKRGISGGERRRLSIGVELIVNPGILFLDEPTSGLDSYNAAQVMETLSTLAHKSKRTVICSIHQPRSDIYAMFDQVVLVSNGSIVYFGAGNAASQHFKNRQLPCPPGYNIADHLLDIAFKFQNEGLPEHVSATTTATDRHSGSPDKASKAIRRSTVANASSDDLDSSAKTLEDVVVMSEMPKPSDQDSYGKTPYTASFLTQLGVLLHRSWIHFWRQPGLFLTHLAVSAVIGVFLGGVYWKADSSLSGIQNRLGSIFFQLSLLGFSSLSAISMIFDIIPLRIIPGLVMTIPPFWMIGYTAATGSFVRYVCVMAVFSANCGLFCLAIGCAISEYGTAVLVASISLLFQMLFAGLLVNQVQITGALKWIQYLSYFKYGFEAIAINDAAGLNFSDQISNVDFGVAASAILAKFGLDITAFWRDLTISIGLFLALMMIVLLLVTFKIRERR
eukprot:jgi/Hompol1/5908/HPOL_004754-RA